MTNRWPLVAVSTVQLGAGVAGQLIALRDQRAFDVPGWRGRPERVARDSWLQGTGLSAPVVMLAAQTGITVSLAARPSRWATRALGGLGAAMACGYLVEREFRDAMTPAGFNPAVTAVAGAGFGFALGMAVLGLAPQDD